MRLYWLIFFIPCLGFGNAIEQRYQFLNQAVPKIQQGNTCLETSIADLISYTTGTEVPVSTVQEQTNNPSFKKDLSGPYISQLQEWLVTTYQLRVLTPPELRNPPPYSNLFLPLRVKSAVTNGNLAWALNEIKNSRPVCMAWCLDSKRPNYGHIMVLIAYDSSRKIYTFRNWWGNSTTEFSASSVEGHMAALFSLDSL